MFVIELSYKKPTEVIDALMEKHISFLDKYYESGNFHFTGRETERDGGLILGGFPSREATHLAILEDPLYASGAASYRIIEFHPTRVREGLINSLTDFESNVS